MGVPRFGVLSGTASRSREWSVISRSPSPATLLRSPAAGAVLPTFKADLLSPSPALTPAPPPGQCTMPSNFLSPDYPTYSPPTRPQLGEARPAAHRLWRV